MQTERLESMSPNGSLKLFRQDDGDIIVVVIEDKARSISAAEFCTPFAGGGGSIRTYAALIQLMGAMAADNLDNSQTGRKPMDVNEDDQKALVEWAKQCRQAGK
tara:strand:- start:25 stop:336 length:312 start_codon:yes stop_codon:yes gene_type:complete